MAIHRNNHENEHTNLCQAAQSPALGPLCRLPAPQCHSSVCPPQSLALPSMPQSPIWRLFLSADTQRPGGRCISSSASLGPGWRSHSPALWSPIPGPPLAASLLFSSCGPSGPFPRGEVHGSPRHYWVLPSSVMNMGPPGSFMGS